MRVVVAVLAVVVAAAPAALAGFTAVPRDVVADGDRLVVLGDYDGTHAVTGESFHAPFARQSVVWSS